MFGWPGKILRIDLNRKSFEFDTPDPKLFYKYIGGRGLAGYFLKNLITLPYDDPEMPVLFFTGPLVNTKSPTSGRMTVMSKSPLTGTIGDSSVGGSLGTMLKKAGFDGIIITGRSEHLCGIEIIDNRIHFVSASTLAGQTVSELTRILKDKGATAIIGPAAENGVLYSSIMIDGHYAAGRMGLGLNLAAKNIKYITVKGTGKMPARMSFDWLPHPLPSWGNTAYPNSAPALSMILWMPGA
jgi:aldehyde:ferredoxin oxidoreductase